LGEFVDRLVKVFVLFLIAASMVGCGSSSEEAGNPAGPPPAEVQHPRGDGPARDGGTAVR
jgi:hypothetical protein